MDEQLLAIGRMVLKELEWFAGGFRLAPSTPQVELEQRRLTDEPFIAYVKVQESIDRQVWNERVYLICRNDTPLGIEPYTENSTYANRNAPIGRIASLEPDDEIIITLPRIVPVEKTIRVIEKDIFIPLKRDVWDAINNQIAYGFTSEFVRSLRAIIEIIVVPGLALLDEIQRVAEHEALRTKEEVDRKLHRLREIVESIALKDQQFSIVHRTCSAESHFDLN